MESYGSFIELNTKEKELFIEGIFIKSLNDDKSKKDYIEPEQYKGTVADYWEEWTDPFPAWS